MGFVWAESSMSFRRRSTVNPRRRRTGRRLNPRQSNTESGTNHCSLPHSLHLCNPASILTALAPQRQHWLHRDSTCSTETALAPYRQHWLHTDSTGSIQTALAPWLHGITLHLQDRLLSPPVSLP